jgi:predicted DNA-binding transcriptional regulator AlpA
MNNQPAQLITETETFTLLKVSRATVRRWSKNLPNFPKPIKLGPFAIRYELAAILAFIEDQKRGIGNA